jgi:hypothetical protein
MDIITYLWLSIITWSTFQKHQKNYFVYFNIQDYELIHKMYS